MPRYSLGKSKVSIKDKTLRARKYRVTGQAKFIDQFPLGFGTLPEKMVYAALSRRGIPFYYLGNVNIAIREIDLFKTYQADFIIPSLMLIIEVQGAFWHSKPGSIESDALKFALYQQAGYRVLGWWDYEIIAGVDRLFINEPLFAGYNNTNFGSTELVPVDRTKTDSSKGIRTLNAKRGARSLWKKPPPHVR